MVHAHQRQIERPRQRLGRRHPDQERPDQSGPVPNSDGVQIVKTAPGFLDRSRDNARDPFRVRPAGKLGHDPAVFLVDLLLTGHDTRSDPPPILHDRAGRFITRTLDPQDEHAEE